MKSTAARIASFETNVPRYCADSNGLNAALSPLIFTLNRASESQETSRFLKYGSDAFMGVPKYPVLTGPVITVLSVFRADDLMD